MNAIIRLGNGEYYCSPVFGYYDDVREKYKYNAYYIAMSCDKKTLIKQPKFDPDKLQKNGSLDPLVLIYAPDKTGWKTDKNGIGGIDFLSKRKALSIIKSGTVPAEILERCKTFDCPVDFSKEQKITSSKEIDGFLWVTDCFHDARIDKIVRNASGSLSVFFEGLWGCNVEVIFSGDVAYNADIRTGNDCAPYWFRAAVLQKDGFFYFVDDDEADISNLQGCCWFKGRSISYRLTPL